MPYQKQVPDLPRLSFNLFMYPWRIYSNHLKGPYARAPRNYLRRNHLRIEKTQRHDKLSCGLASRSIKYASLTLSRRLATVVATYPLVGDKVTTCSWIRPLYRKPSFRSTCIHTHLCISDAIYIIHFMYVGLNAHIRAYRIIDIKKLDGYSILHIIWPEFYTYTYIVNLDVFYGHTYWRS